MSTTTGSELSVARSVLRARTSVARAVAAGAVIIAASAQIVAGQAPEHGNRGVRLLVSRGAVIPTGAQRTAIARGAITAAQLSYGIGSAVAVTATLGWARSRDAASTDRPKLNVFTYDLGAEIRGSRWQISRLLSFTPIGSLGAGGRSYDYRSLDVAATHNVAGFGGVGGELGVGRVHVRLDARNYVTGFRPLRGAGATVVRNDVMVLVGLRLARR